MVPAMGQAQQYHLYVVPTAGVSIGKDGRGPQLQVAAAAVGAVGIFSGEGCWVLPDLFLPCECGG